MEYLEKPEDLCDDGESAYTAIMEVLRRKDATNTGGCKAFYSPSEWRARGEKYGLRSVLLVVYDGGEHRRFFNMDDASFSEYSEYEEMRKALEKKGLYMEECTTWYGAIYEMP